MQKYKYIASNELRRAMITEPRIAALRKQAADMYRRMRSTGHGQMARLLYTRTMQAQIAVERAAMKGFTH